MLLRPEQILVQPGQPNGGLIGRIATAGYHGHDTIVHIQTDQANNGQHLIARTPANTQLKPGTHVNLAVHGPVHIWLHARAD